MSEGLHISESVFIEVKLNDIELTGDEIKYANMQFELGRGMATCELLIKTDRDDLLDNSILEMSTIVIEIGIPDDNGTPVVSKKGRFFLAKTVLVNSLDSSGTSVIKLIGVSDAYKFLGEPKIWSLDSKDSTTKFLSKISGVGSGQGEISIEIKDDLISRTMDKQYWIQYNTTGIETLNTILLRSLVTPKSGKNEWMYSFCVDTKKNGDHVVYLYDIKLRTSTFGVKDTVYGKASFSYTKQDKIVYDACELDLKGADYSSMYWRRNAFAFDMEEGTHWSRQMSQPELFPDSAEYVDQTKIDGKNPPKDKMPIFKSQARLNHQFFNSNMYSKYYVDQKVEITALLLALRKINLRLTFNRKLIDIMPGEICESDFRINQDDNNNKDLTRLCGKYMVTRTIYEYDRNSVNTYLVISRDSFVKS